MEYIQAQPSLAKLCLKMVLIFLCIGTVLAFVAAYSMYGEGTLKITIMDMAIWLDQLFAIMVNPANTYEMVDEVIDYGIELGYDCTDIVTIHSIDNEGHLSMFDRAWYSDDKCSFVEVPLTAWIWDNFLSSA